LLLFFHFETSTDKLVDLIASLKVALGKLVINVVARIGVPNESRDFYEKLTISSEPGIAPRLAMVRPGAARLTKHQRQHDQEDD
jgi:hypothetical protein